MVSWVGVLSGAAMSSRKTTHSLLKRAAVGEIRRLVADRVAVIDARNACRAANVKGDMAITQALKLIFKV